MRIGAFLFLLLLCLGSTAQAQSVNPGRPPEVQVQKVPSAEAMAARMKDLHLQNDAKELAALSSSLGPDLDGVKQGVLQTNLLEKLKRMEKLCKRVREELTR